MNFTCKSTPRCQYPPFVPKYIIHIAIELMKTKEKYLLIVTFYRDCRINIILKLSIKHGGKNGDSFC